tara:strand:- start:47 stop:376 length:330 start_codon:yes stop_codon:yes gene_type:complete
MFNFSIEATAKGGSKISGHIDIAILCSSNVNIIPPEILSESYRFKETNTGKLNYELNEYSTDDPMCDVTNYRLKSENAELTQDECEPSGNTDGCRKITMESSKEGTYPI